MRRRDGYVRISFGAALVVSLLGARAAHAQLVVAEPLEPIAPALPPSAPRIDAQIVLQLVIDAKGNVESAVETSHAPPNAPSEITAAAIDAVKRAKFRPSTRDNAPVRSRIEYVVVFRAPPPPAPPPAASPTSTAPAVTTSEQDEDYDQVHVQALTWPSPRGLGDFRVKRELLEASPREQTGELLSAAPGFFVDHEDGEGIGNDIYLRGFDLSHGSGIELRVGSIPLNIPTHIQGQGYADLNFILPEVVRSIRVLEGVYDPRQGDAAIVGSAYFDLGVPERGYQLKSSYGSFNHARIVGIVAPKGEDEETFLAFGLRHTDGFGPSNRASTSGAAMAQYAMDLDARTRLRLSTSAHAAHADLPGVVRRDDIDAGRLGWFDSYPGPFGQGQGALSSRAQIGVDLDRTVGDGAHLELTAWSMLTDLRLRQNFTGALETSRTNPTWFGRGDLLETTNHELAFGASARFRPTRIVIARGLEVVPEPGMLFRFGHTDQTKSLVDPTTLLAWDRRIDARIDTADLGAYLDVDLRIGRRFRISGGPRADVLLVSVNDALAGAVPEGATASTLVGAHRNAFGIVAGPRVSAEWDVTPGVAPVISYGEGFRSLDAAHLPDGSRQPYSKVRSAEVGIRAHTPGERYVTSIALFETWVGNELVFEPEAGGLATENASVRSGVVGSIVAKPFAWLLGSLALSVVRATYETTTAGGNHFVPNVPPLLLRADVVARHRLGTIAQRELGGRLGLGFTYLGARHLSDTVRGDPSAILNVGAGARYGNVELGVDAFNLFDVRYADDEALYVSNLGVGPGPHAASFARHVTAAPPLTLLATLSLFFE